ncbi:MAG TPA: universal stress protein [Chthoniobacterales bacterium]|jgi:nucleotide-binding universal stress UspA family protein|nr:universal stress protein [Chthoniobacterales bacterium]
MNPIRNYTYPIIGHVLHPTDFSEASLTAFHHALKAALIAQARLTLIHVTDENSGEVMDFPGVRAALERWSLLPKDSPHSAIRQLRIEVRKVVAGRAAPVEGVLKYLEQRPADLMCSRRTSTKTGPRGYNSDRSRSRSRAAPGK